jgi:hypothetical protein
MTWGYPEGIRGTWDEEELATIPFENKIHEY